MNLNIILVFVLSLLFVTVSQSLTPKQIIPSSFTVEKAVDNRLAATVTWDGANHNDNQTLYTSLLCDPFKAIEVDNMYLDPVFGDRKVTFGLIVFIPNVAVTCRCDMDTNADLDSNERWTLFFGFETPST